MSQKKRVRVYAPQVNTDHFANYIFQTGGPVGQGPIPAMEQQSQDISQDLTEILQMYAQAMGMDEQQMQQMYSAVMQMEPDQQAQAIAQMQQELNSTMAENPMVAKNGGDIKSTKRLLHKKIGGANTNMTSANLVDQRKQIVKDAIGANMARDIVNQVTEEKLSQANNMMGYAANLMNTQPRMDYGGYANAPSQSMGYRDVEDNPFYNAMSNIEDRVGQAWDRFGSAVGNIRMTPSNEIKVKRRGDIFKNPAQASTQPPTNEFFRQDLDTNQIPDYLQLDTAQAYNENLYPMAYGGTSTYQPGGSTYVPSSYDVAFEDLNINDEDYHRALQAYESGTHNQQQLDLINQVQNYAAKVDPSLKKNMSATTTVNNNPATQQTGSKGINGWYGGFFWKDGVAVTSLEDVQKQQNANQSNAFNWASLFQPGNRNMTIQGNLLNLATNPEAIKKFGEGLTKFQPDDVYLSKAKGRVNPFGAKVVLKWDYDENGRPVQKEVVEEEGTSDRFSGRNLMGRMFKNSDMYANIVQRRAERNANRFGYDTGSDESSATSSTSTNSPTTSSTSTSTNAPLSRTSGSGMESIYEPEITTPNPVYAPVNPSPRQTMEDIGEEEFAYGGMPKARAGKMVIKQKFKPDMSTMGQAISPTFDMVSSLLEQRDLNQMENRIYTPDVYMGSVPMGSMSMGTKGMGPLMGKENRFASNLGVTGNYGDSLYQNVPGYELSGQMPYQPMGKYGGMYQEGGSYELTDDEIDDIINRGGEIEYF